MHARKFERAILSVSDKAGIVELGRFLAGRGIEILSTGGTASFLTDAGIPVTPISKWSGAPEILGGRVKTLTPKVFGAILHDRSNREHLADCEASSIPAVDLVVVNLYPFEQAITRKDISLAEAIEQIDVGGPSMLRAAAKNHQYVLPVCSPALYPELMRQIEHGEIAEDFRRRLALEVFRMTAAYDRAIAGYFESVRSSSKAPEVSAGESIPASLTLHLVREQDLRYGENPQQCAGFYRSQGSDSPGFVQLHGKELSYNNLMDLDAALLLAFAFEEPACTIIKHTNPCGTATGTSIDEALRAAIVSDPQSAFGGIVGANREFTLRAAQEIETLFLEVVVAPSFSPDAVEHLRKKKNLRLIEAASGEPGLQMRSAMGGYLLQSSDRLSDVTSWRCVTLRQPEETELRALRFAWTVAAYVKSNAIVLSNNRQSIGIGAGQMSRVDSARIAIMKATLPIAGSVAASDAFFPFRDGLDLLIDAGVSAVIQPGGSLRDEEVIAAANERGIAMLFTGERHFRH